MTGLLAYFEEMPDMERLYNEFTHLIRNGLTVSKYLKGANVMDDPEVRSAVKKGFGDIAGFLKDMLEIQENEELRKDFNACKEAVSILKVEASEAEEHFQESGENINNGDIQSAIKNLSKAIELDPVNGLYYYNRGTAKKMMLDYELAIPDLTKSIELNIEHLEMAYFNRAMCKFNTQYIKGSREDNKKARELGYDDYEVEVLDGYIDAVEELGFDEFMNHYG